MPLPKYADISQFQPPAGQVDWQAYVEWAKQWDGTARLACRASEGVGVADTNYQGYVSQARNSGVQQIIHYHYAYPNLNSAVDEAAWCFKVVSGVGLGPNDLVMLDFEENVTTGLDSDWALAFLQQVEKLFGRTPVIYASVSMVQNRLQNPALAKYPLILASWTTETPMPPAPWQSYFAWQYTSTGRVPGFGAVDVDVNILFSNPTITLHNGCVLDLQKSYQLDGGSQDKCGPWSVSELLNGGLPGDGPTGDARHVQAWAHAEYEKYIGPDVLSNQDGSSIDNMHQFMHDAGLHWWDIAAINDTSAKKDDVARVTRALDAGYPVLVTVNEQSVQRRDGSNPYPWQPRLGPVNHIFTVVGHTNDGFFLVDDELNLGDSWPDQYNALALEIHWASTVQVVGPDTANPWLLGIPDSDPLKWPTNYNAQNFIAQGANAVGVPAGWHDDGTTLTAPNGVAVVHGFRQHILNSNWDAANVPLEAEYHVSDVELHNTSLGSGQIQIFRDNWLWWTSAQGVVEEPYKGLELDAAYKAIGLLSSQVAALTKQVADLQANAGIPPALQSVINSGASTLAALEAQLQPFVK